MHAQSKNVGAGNAGLPFHPSVVAIRAFVNQVAVVRTDSGETVKKAFLMPILSAARGLAPTFGIG